MVEKAIDRLKYAYRKWNTQPRIIVPKEDFVKVNNIVNLSEKDFKDKIKIYEPSQIIKLREKKRELRELEQNLNLY